MSPIYESPAPRTPLVPCVDCGTPTEYGRCWDCWMQQKITPAFARAELARAQAAGADITQWPYAELVAVAAEADDQTRQLTQRCPSTGGDHDYGNGQSGKFCINCGHARTVPE